MKRYIRIIILISLTLTACAGNHPKLKMSTCAEPGTIGNDQVLEPTQGFEISFDYYLPPCYDDQQTIGYPAIYLITMPVDLHLSDTDNTPMSLADRLIHAGKIPPVIIIIPRATVAEGYHAALAKDLVPYADEKFNTIRMPEYRGVGGISHGAGIAARMAFQFPEVFGSLGVLSGGIDISEKPTFNEWISVTPTDQLPRVKIDVGDQDAIARFTQNLTSVLDGNKVPYEMNIGQGDHNWAFWSPLMEPYLLWFAAAWK